MTVKDLGDPIVFAVTVKDNVGAPTNATTCVLTVTKPDGTTSTPVVTNVGTGLYEATVVSTVAGLYQGAWVTTGPAAAYHEVFTVRPAGEVLLISLDDARQHLNLVSRTADEELRETILVATYLIEQLIGPVLPTVFTEVHDGGGTVIPLDHRIISIDTVTMYPGGVVPAATGSNRGYLIDGVRGLELVSGYTPVVWGARVSVTYTAGVAATTPPIVRQAARELVRHMWDTQRGPIAPRTLEGEGFYPGLSFTLPRRVVELLDLYMTPGVA